MSCYARQTDAVLRRLVECGLTAPVGVVRQGMGCRLAVIQRLLQRIQHEVCLHAAADPPAHYAACVHVNNEGCV